MGPTPLVLVFTDGQTVGDIMCAEVTILDDFVPLGERNFSISIGDDAGTAGAESGGRGGGGGVHINSDEPSITINIELDVDDRKCYI